jgi:ribose 5-phosphate isomerase B
MDKTLAAASDHTAVDIRRRLTARLAEGGWSVTDHGPADETSVDYPGYAARVADAVAAGQSAAGLLLCGTGLGMSYAANRRRGVRAALCWSVETARLAREHNDANILVLPARARTLDPLEDIADAFFSTAFPGEPRHQRRIAQIDARP